MPRKFPGHFTACGASGGACAAFQTLSGLPAYEGPCGLKACRRSLCALLSVSAAEFFDGPILPGKISRAFQRSESRRRGAPGFSFFGNDPGKIIPKECPLAALALPGSGAVQALLKAVSLFCGHRRTAWRHPQKRGCSCFLNILHSFLHILSHGMSPWLAFGGLP